jgi:galactofuranose transport system substrate-binding protein
VDSKVLFLGGRPHGKGGWLGNESGAEKYILFPCKAEVAELMDVNGHGVTLFFCRGEKWVKFCDRSRLPPAQRIPNQVRGAPENTTNCSPQNMKMTAIYKIYLALLAFPALFALTQPQASAADAAQKKLVVGFAQVGAESGWRTANTESIKSEAQKRGIDLRFSDAQQKEENQIKAIRSFIAQGVDVIAFSPVVETGFEPVLQEAKKAGIPVVLSDRAVKVSDPSLYVTFLGSDFVEEGRRAANAVAKLTGGKANIAELVGTVGSAPAIDRKKGFEEVLAKYPDMKIIMSQSGDFTRAKGKEVMEAFLKSPNAKEINVLFAHNDDMALGAIQAMEEAGIKPGQDIKIVSIDGVRGAFEAMKDGKLNVTVECNPLLGPQLFDLIEKVANKEEIPKRVVSQEGVYEQSQAAAELPKRQY